MRIRTFTHTKKGDGINDRLFWHDRVMSRLGKALEALLHSVDGHSLLI